MYRLLYSPQAKKDAKKLKNGGLKKKAELLLELIEKEPYAYPPEYEALRGRLRGFISR
jgi:Txe/YoeB family toxin of Txe-Axe toxin-antitoxin module